MIKYIFKRFMYGLLVLYGVITIVFVLFNVLPGDPTSVLMGQHPDEESRRILRKDFNLDLPLYKQYLMFLNDISVVSIHNEKDSTSRIYLDSTKYGHPFKLFGIGGGKVVVLKSPYLRRSYVNRQPVWDKIKDCFPSTLVLAFTAIAFASFLGIFLGVVCALKKNSVFDRIVSVISSLGVSIPSFFSALIIAWLFGYVWNSWTGLNNTGSLYSDDPYRGHYLDLKNLILPAFTLGIRPLALVIQLTRSSMIEVMSFDYIRTARAKGLSTYKVVIKHALKNALNPVITAISGWLAGLMAGAVFVEGIFAWNGIGSAVVEAVFNYDFPLVMGTTLIFSTCFVFLNIIVDIVYAFLDPRVKLQ